MQDIVIALTLLVSIMQNTLLKKPTGEIVEAYNLIALQEDNDFPPIKPNMEIPDLALVMDKILDSMIEDDDIFDLSSLIGKIKARVNREDLDDFLEETGNLNG